MLVYASAFVGTNTARVSDNSSVSASVSVRDNASVSASVSVNVSLDLIYHNLGKACVC